MHYHADDTHLTITSMKASSRRQASPLPYSCSTHHHLCSRALTLRHRLWTRQSSASTYHAVSLAPPWTRNHDCTNLTQPRQSLSMRDTQGLHAWNASGAHTLAWQARPRHDVRDAMHALEFLDATQRSLGTSVDPNHGTQLIRIQTCSARFRRECPHLPRAYAPRTSPPTPDGAPLCMPQHKPCPTAQSGMDGGKRN